MRASPASSSARSASRIGPRLVPKRAAMSLSLMRVPGGSSPVMIRRSISSCTSIGSELERNSWMASVIPIAPLKFPNCKLSTVFNLQLTVFNLRSTLIPSYRRGALRHTAAGQQDRRQIC
ncbi:protein of unknown function (plasmid) [Cupriavidus taiwanensis]|uniref:Uncharacterized protein n=1 Tax=Cupriavidus taiwanensis TaxID=164546 RepID=A0A375ILZ4_9BURK|nr:protein of unknown function [Cupriavidus taiwanensis]